MKKDELTGGHEYHRIHDALSDTNLKRLEKLRLMDDTFLSEALDGQIDAVQYIVNTVLERTDLKVVRAESQREYHSAASRSIRLDIQAEDTDGRIADIEVQRADDPSLILRARYYAAMIDSRMLQKGAQFSSLKQRFVIFITESDPFHLGLPLYHIHNVIDELNCADAGDGAMTVFVNGAFQDEKHPVGQLVHDFKCTHADDMFIQVLARPVRYMKETKGGQARMCRIMEEALAERETQIYCELVLDGVMSTKEAARRDGKTEEEFRACLAAYLAEKQE